MDIKLSKPANTVRRDKIPAGTLFYHPGISRDIYLAVSTGSCTIKNPLGDLKSHWCVNIITGNVAYTEPHSDCVVVGNLEIIK